MARKKLFVESPIPKFELNFQIHNDYQDVYDLGGNRRYIPGPMRFEIGCGLIDEGRKMNVEEFIFEVQNLEDEKAHMFNLVLKECTDEIKHIQLPYNGKSITLSDLCVIMLPFLNEKMERVAYEKELDKYLNEKR